MADRTVKVNLTATTAGYTTPIKDASATTLKLAAAQKEQGAAAKAAAVETVSAAQKIAVAEKQAALASAEAAAKEAVGDEATVAAKKAVEAASKDLAKQETASARAVTAAQREAKAANGEAVAAQKAVEDATKKTGESYVNTGQKMMLAGTALVGVFALAEKATSSFDTAISGVGAVANASAAQIGQLRGAALQAGKDTAYTATQAAQAEGELVKAGVSVQNVLSGGLSGALSLAAAGQLDLADAATIDANALNIFNLKGSDASHVADVLAAGANKSAADVGQLANGMEQGGLVASQLGLSLEDTTATLSAFADRGLKGADAGTSMKTMLERLASPTGAAAKQMNALGISTYDASGKFVGITSIAGQLHDTLGQLTEAQRNQALQTIFGSDAIRGATVLYNLGADGMKGYVQSVNDSGAASRMAAMQLDNLGGDLKQLRGSIDVALIQGGSSGNQVLRELTQSATGAVNAFAGLPKPLQEIAVGFTGGGGAALLLVGSLTTAAGKVGTMRKSLSELEETATGAKGALAKAGSFMAGPWGLAIAGAVTVAGLFAGAMGKDKIAVADFTDAIKQDGDALGSHTAAQLSADFAGKGLYTRMTSVGLSMDTVTTAALGNAAAMQLVESTLTAAAKAADTSGRVLGKGQSADNSRSQALLGDLKLIQATSDSLAGQRRAEQQTTAATQAYASSATDAASVQERLAQAAKEAAQGTMQRTAAARAAADAARAEGVDTDSATIAIKGSTAAKGASTKASKDAAAAARADAASQRAQASAQKAANTATNDATKAATANAKAQGANADASDTNSYANSTAAGAAKSAAGATRDKTKAQNADTTSANANISANQAAARAHNAGAKAAAAHAKATTDAANAAAGDAAAQAAAAEAAREAAFEHQIGTEALKGWAAAAANADASTNSLDDATTAEVAAMKDAQAAASTLKDGLDALDGVHISAGRAAVEVQNKIADLTKAFDANGKSLDITTAAGRANTSAIYDTADAIIAHAQAVTQETGSVDAGNKALQASKDEFDKVLAAAGLSKGEIQQFNDELLSIPKVVPVALSVDSATALSELKQFKDSLGNLTAVHIGGTTGRAGLATGGRVAGPGTPTSDSVPINASRDEYVINAKAAARIGYSELDRLNFGGSPATLVRPQYAGAVGGTTAHPAAGAAAATLQLVAGPEANSGVSDLINYLIRTRKLVIKGVNA